MTGRLRGLWERPVADRDRQRLFAITAVVLALATALLTLTADSRRDGHAIRSQHADAQAAARGEPPAPSAVPAAASGRSAADQGSRGPARRSAIRAARRFLRGYLAYLYGHGRARRIAGVAARLRRRLAVNPPRISPATRRRHPHVERLTGQRLPRRRGWVVTATIADGGVASYPIELVVADRAGHARVVRLAGD